MPESNETPTGTANIDSHPDEPFGALVLKCRTEETRDAHVVISMWSLRCGLNFVMTVGATNLIKVITMPSEVTTGKAAAEVPRPREQERKVHGRLLRAFSWFQSLDYVVLKTEQVCWTSVETVVWMQRRRRGSTCMRGMSVVLSEV